VPVEDLLDEDDYAELADEAATDHDIAHGVLESWT